MKKKKVTVYRVEAIGIDGRAYHVSIDYTEESQATNHFTRIADSPSVQSGTMKYRMVKVETTVVETTEEF